MPKTQYPQVDHEAQRDAAPDEHEQLVDAVQALLTEVRTRYGMLPGDKFSCAFMQQLAALTDRDSPADLGVVTAREEHVLLLTDAVRIYGEALDLFPDNTLSQTALALAEEAGEAVKVFNEIRYEGKGELSDLSKELAQTIAMSLRLYTEMRGFEK